MKNPQTKESKKWIDLDFLSVLLAFAVAFSTVCYVYHRKVVRPIQEKVAASSIYVIDLDGLVEDFKRRAVEKALAGEEVHPTEVAETVRRYLDAVLSELPPEAVVLDARCVLKGGLYVPLIAPPKRDVKITWPEKATETSRPRK